MVKDHLTSLILLSVLNLKWISKAAGVEPDFVVGWSMNITKLVKKISGDVIAVKQEITGQDAHLSSFR